MKEASVDPFFRVGGRGRGLSRRERAGVGRALMA